MDLDQAYGGLTMTDEAPAFDDPYLIAEDAQDAGRRVRRSARGRSRGARDGADALTTAPASPTSAWSGACSTARAPTATAVDWTGSLSVDRGLLIVRRVVLFEPRTDSIVRPRPDRQTVAFESFTGGHFDGLVVQIIERPQDIDGERPNQLHFATGPLTTSFVVAELPAPRRGRTRPTRGQRRPLRRFPPERDRLLPRGLPRRPLARQPPTAPSRAASSAAAGSARTASPKATCAAVTA